MVLSRSTRLIAVPAVLSFVTLVLASTCSQAAIRTVSSKADSGPGSLRATLAAADANDTINFSVTGNIVLTSGQLTIDKSLVINGPGAANLNITRSTDAAIPTFRILKVEAGAVKINDLTISGGKARATDSASNGGGIYSAVDVNLVLSKCRIVDNISFADGGGIFNLGRITLNRCTLSGNRAGLVGTDLGVRGGGLRNGSQSAILNNCTVVDNSTVEVGDRSDQGGGIYSEGTLSIRNCTIARNASSSGGGIRRQNGSLTMTDTSIIGNVARDGHGGGLNFNTDPSGPATPRGLLTRCTFSGNIAGKAGSTARSGGAIYNQDVLVVVNCTLANNTARANGGGIRNFGTLRVLNCTIAGNTCVTGDGGGIANTIGATVSNSIIALNSSPSTPDVVGAFSSGGYNLIGNKSGSTSFENGVKHDKVGTDSDPLDPRLGPLQNNGGPTATRALLAGSPAINAGNNGTAPSTDQRGYTRVGVSDIGAFEVGGVPAIFKPDLLIRNDSDAAFIGDDIYNTSAAGQTKAQTTGTAPAVYFVKLENDGNTRDVFKVKGTAGDANTGVTYTDTTTNENITSEVTGAGWSRALAAGDSRLIKVTVTSQQLVPTGSKTVVVTATSTSNTAKKDVVQANTTFSVTASANSA